MSLKRQLLALNQERVDGIMTLLLIKPMILTVLFVTYFLMFVSGVSLSLKIKYHNVKSFITGMSLIICSVVQAIVIAILMA